MTRSNRLINIDNYEVKKKKKTHTMMIKIIDNDNMVDDNDDIIRMIL